MKIVKKSQMPDGTEIQIENWKADYPGVFTELTIAAYPKAKRTGRNRWIEGGKTFRLELSRNFESDEEVLRIFSDLENGNIKLEDLDKHYWNGDKDRFYMGFESVPEEPKEYILY